MFATNDDIQQLGGDPFQNTTRVSIGSSNDVLLDAGLKRHRADPAALADCPGLRGHRTPEDPACPLHTANDKLIPCRHQAAYAAKVSTTGNGGLRPISIPRFGHCNFTSTELVGGFAVVL